ncbi:MAG: TFIIB-type zinc ribbon-containing protein [Thermoprotei archaeon]|nr:MAG: TFIIB-type zinc ribbon-containing protein [Thermoprotei archaeon]
MSCKCPICGNTLIWDYQSGEVICSTCGYVVDRIYYYGPDREDEDESLWREIKTRRNPRVNTIAKRYRRHVKLYHIASTYVKGKPWLEIDYDKIFETGRLVHSIKSKATLEAEKNISDRGLWSLVKKGLEFIEKRYPVALARSGRGKYALAYMVATYISTRHFPEVKEVVKVFNISETSYRRLLRIARKIVPEKKQPVIAY